MTDRFNDGVIDLSQFRKEKEEVVTQPFFKEASIIEMGTPDTDEIFRYKLLINLVSGERQIIVIESMQPEDYGDIAIVEAQIEGNDFTGVKAIESEEEYAELVDMVSKHLGELPGYEEEVDENGDNS